MDATPNVNVAREKTQQSTERALILLQRLRYLLLLDNYLPGNLKFQNLETSNLWPGLIGLLYSFSNLLDVPTEVTKFPRIQRSFRILLRQSFPRRSISHS